MGLNIYDRKGYVKQQCLECKNIRFDNNYQEYYCFGSECVSERLKEEDAKSGDRD